MRVGMISPYSLTVPGGVQQQILGLARALRRQGIDVRVLGPCDGPPPEAWITPLGQSLPTATNGSIAPLAPDPSAQLRVIRALRDEAFDLLHVHEPLAPGPTITAIVMKQTPIVATYHRSGESRAYRYLNRLARWVAARVEVNVAVSADAERTARAAVGGTYELLFNGVELDRFRTGEQSCSSPTVLFLGRHEPRKGLAVLVEAMERLPDSVRLWVAGEGPETTAMRRETAGDSRIEWLGRIGEADKAERLQQASVLCAPSLGGESFGVVLLEAMAAGTPVVASDLPGYSQLARGGRDARLVAPGDPQALAAALHEVLFGGAAVDLVASGRKRAEMFSMEVLAQRYRSLYERALAVAPVAPLAAGRSSPARERKWQARQPVC
jgi:phosphatidylinositol alpha-mannosyltransferase